MAPLLLVATAIVRMAQPAPVEPRYTKDLGDAELQDRWLHAPESLGSISFGYANRGRLLNAVHMPEGNAAFMVERPELAWGTQETVDALTAAFAQVHARFPWSAPARLSQIGSREGGYLFPHRSHRTGQDADIGFFYRKDRTPLPGIPRERQIDPARNWALLRALVTGSDVQLVVVDRRIQSVLRRYAIASGEDPGWVKQVFDDLVRHEEKHRDHFHVRFYSPRSRELGLRLQPLLTLRPEQNLAIHNVQPGETLGRIARLYGSSVVAIRKANGLSGSKLPRGEQLLVPLRSACASCMALTPLVVRPRLLPPSKAPSVGVATMSGAP